MKSTSILKIWNIRLFPIIYLSSEIDENDQIDFYIQDIETAFLPILTLSSIIVENNEIDICIADVEILLILIS